MKKNTFVYLIVSTIGGILFALGMVGSLIPKNKYFYLSLLLGISGLLVLLLALIAYRRSMNKKGPRPTKTVLKISTLIVGSCLLLGTGMSLVMVYSQIILGILLGIVGLLLLFGLIPLTIGIKK
ncbi:MAG: hypothetical protein ABF682_10280 [Liquorilactobacillus sp.]|uniref:hypothetical protein n=1 Tax=Liquorilactobacillus TaxID=2767888 RepID=UPI0039EC22AB